MNLDAATGPASWIARITAEPLLAIVVVGVAVLVLTVVANIAWLIVRGLIDARVRRERDHFWSVLGHDLVGAIGDVAAEDAWVARARAYPPRVLRHCVDAYMRRTSGDFREGIARVHRGLGLMALDLVSLRSRRLGVRMRALRRLATVVTAEHRDAIIQLADAGGEVRLLVGQIIGRIGTPDDVIQLLSTWRVTSRLGEYPIHVMLGAMSPEALRQVLPTWERIPSEAVQRIVLGEASRIVPDACRGLVAKATRHPSMELRIAACHAAGRMTTDETLQHLCVLARDATWEVRAQAMKSLGAHRSTTAAVVLATALCDDSFWVRQNAAAALGAFGADGVRRLREVAAQAADRFARDAAEHVLADLALARAEPAARPTGVAA